MKDQLTAFFDGACEYWKNPETGITKRNPGGIATYGWVIYRGPIKLAWGYGEVKRGDGATNNVAEYTALISLIKAYNDLRLTEPLHVSGDSQLVVKQMSGDYRVKAPLLKPLYQQVVDLKPPGMVLTWISGDQNEEADALSREAYQISLKGDKPWEKRFRT